MQTLMRVWITLTALIIFAKDVYLFRVAVVGGGIGGTSAAYFLSALLAKEDQIDLYELNDGLGGRVKAVEFAGGKYEVGASIIHEKNHYAVSLAREFGLLPRNGSADLVAIYDGTQFVFTESPLKLVTLWRMFARYGIDIVKLPILIQGMLKDFAGVYFLQREGFTFKDVSELLRAMSIKFPSLTSMTLRHYLLEEVGLTEKSIDELVQASTLVNYGQNVTEMHAFVGSVSAAGFGGSLWSISGGNQRLPENLAKASRAKVMLNSRVSEVAFKDKKFNVILSSNGSSQKYDAVVLATPLHGDSLQFSGFSAGVNDYLHSIAALPYHRTVVTLVAGHMKPMAGKTHESVISCNPNLFFLSSSKLRPVDGFDEQVPGRSVYKVFSRQPLTEAQINSLFEYVHDVRVIDFQAYPEYAYLRNMKQMPRFLVKPGLYHINAVEWGASAMEMSLLAAKNAALLVDDHRRITINNKKR